MLWGQKMVMKYFIVVVLHCVNSINILNFSNHPLSTEVVNLENNFIKTDTSLVVIADIRLILTFKLQKINKSISLPPTVKIFSTIFYAKNISHSSIAIRQKLCHCNVTI